MPRDHRPVWDIQDFAPSGASRLLERLLDVDGTETFEFEMHVDDGDWMKDSYVVRQGRNVEIGYITKRGGPQRAQHGVRYEVQDVDSSLPFSFGAWKPVSTSDDGSDWGGSHMWIRAQSTAIAKGIWFHKHWNGKFIAIAEWSGMTEEKTRRNRQLAGRACRKTC
ncbi:hypothetical protein C8J56DRAFT_121773 [Mycena floridula]|nr:hypothetical protein C8J56DRAFT_121773 [Mycena floridula]